MGARRGSEAGHTTRVSGMSNDTRRRPFRRTPALLGLLTLAMILLPVPPYASARPQDGALDGSGYSVDLPPTGRGWYGAYHVGDVTAFCTDLNSGPPRKASGWTEISEPGFRKQSGWSADAAGHGSSDVSVSDVELARMAWALQTVGRNPAPAVAAAAEHLVRRLTILGPQQEARESTRWAAVVNAHPEVSAEYERLAEAAENLAGPYRLSAEWSPRPTSEEPTGSLVVEVRAASGLPVPGVTITARGLGGVTVSGTEAVTTSDGRVRLGVDMDDPGEVGVTGTVEVTAAGLPATRPRLFVPDEPTVQRLVAAGATESLDWDEELRLAPLSWQPKVETRTKDPLALPGQDAVDVVTIAGGRPGATFSGTTRLYGPFETLEALTGSSQEAAHLVGTATFTGVYGPDGGARVDSTSLTFGEPGFYTWVEELQGAPQVVAPAPPAWPQESETALVISPNLTSVLATGEGTTGSARPESIVTDSIRVTGLPTSRAVPASTEPIRPVLSGRLLGPIPAIGEGPSAGCAGIDWSGAPVVADYDGLDPTDDDLTGLLESTLAAPGCYTATARLEISLGSSLITSVDHPAGLPEQTLLIRAPESAPAMPQGPRINAGSPGAPVQWLLLLVAIGGTFATTAVCVADRTRT